MTQDQAIILIQETIGQIDEAIKRLSTIPPLQTFGDSVEQLVFTQSIYDLSQRGRG
jgi:hypothetical protein